MKNLPHKIGLLLILIPVIGWMSALLLLTILAIIFLCINNWVVGLFVISIISIAIGAFLLEHK